MYGVLACMVSINKHVQAYIYCPAEYLCIEVLPATADQHVARCIFMHRYIICIMSSDASVGFKVTLNT